MLLMNHDLITTMNHYQLLFDIIDTLIIEINSNNEKNRLFMNQKINN